MENWAKDVLTRCGFDTVEGVKDAASNASATATIANIPLPAKEQKQRRDWNKIRKEYRDELKRLDKNPLSSTYKEDIKAAQARFFEKMQVIEDEGI